MPLWEASRRMLDRVGCDESHHLKRIRHGLTPINTVFQSQRTPRKGQWLSFLWKQESRSPTVRWIAPLNRSPTTRCDLSHPTDYRIKAQRIFLLSRDSLAVHNSRSRSMFACTSSSCRLLHSDFFGTPSVAVDADIVDEAFPAIISWALGIVTNNRLNIASLYFVSCFHYLWYNIFQIDIFSVYLTK